MEGVESAKSYEQLYRSDIQGLDPAVIVAVLNAAAAIATLFAALRKDRDKGNHQTSVIEIHNGKIENLHISVNNDNEAEKVKDVLRSLDEIEKDK